MTEIKSNLYIPMKTFADNNVNISQWILLVRIPYIYSKWYDLTSGKTEKYLFGKLLQ